MAYSFDLLLNTLISVMDQSKWRHMESGVVSLSSEVAPFRGKWALFIKSRRKDEICLNVVRETQFTSFTFNRRTKAKDFSSDTVVAH